MKKVNVSENKQIAKSLRKLQNDVQKKYSKMMKELHTGGIQSLTFEAKRMNFDKAIVRVKLDYRHRVALLAIDGKIEVLQVATRENFNYVGA